MTEPYNTFFNIIAWGVLGYYGTAFVMSMLGYFFITALYPIRSYVLKTAIKELIIVFIALAWLNANSVI